MGRGGGAFSQYFWGGGTFPPIPHTGGKDLRNVSPFPLQRADPTSALRSSTIGTASEAQHGGPLPIKPLPPRCRVLNALTCDHDGAYARVLQLAHNLDAWHGGRGGGRGEGCEGGTVSGTPYRGTGSK